MSSPIKNYTSSFNTLQQPSFSPTFDSAPMFVQGFSSSVILRVKDPVD